jgi:Putative prokaryotic signal transducing protein
MGKASGQGPRRRTFFGALRFSNAMKELLRTNDPVRLSWAMARLADAGIESLVFDQHAAVVEGSIGAIQRRLMVAERDHRRASALIATPGEGAC